MKVKALTAFLCLLLAFPVLSGCGKHPDTETELSVTESQMTEKQNVSEIPDEVKQRLQAALDTEPITIPAEEWTVDTICQATYINGKNLTIPCTLHDFGDGFEICETEDFPYTVLDRLNGATCSISYYGTLIGFATVRNCDSKDMFLDAQLVMLELDNESEFSTEEFPICINGYGVGSSSNEMRERLYFMDAFYEEEEDDSYTLTVTLDDFHFMCSHEFGKFGRITINFPE